MDSATLKYAPFADEDHNDITAYIVTTDNTDPDDPVDYNEDTTPEVQGEGSVAMDTEEAGNSEEEQQAAADGDPMEQSDDQGSDNDHDEIDGVPMATTDTADEKEELAAPVAPLISAEVEEPRLDASTLALAASSSKQKVTASLSATASSGRQTAPTVTTASSTKTKDRTAEWVLQKQLKVIAKQQRKADRTMDEAIQNKSVKSTKETAAENKSTKQPETGISHSGRVFNVPKYTLPRTNNTTTVYTQPGETINNSEQQQASQADPVSNVEVAQQPPLTADAVQGGEQIDQPVAPRHSDRGGSDDRHRDDRYRDDRQRGDRYRDDRRDSQRDNWGSSYRRYSRSPPRARRDSRDYSQPTHQYNEYSSDNYSQEYSPRQQSYRDEYRGPTPPVYDGGYRGRTDGYYDRGNQYYHEGRAYPPTNYHDRGRPPHRDEHNYHGASSSSRDARERSRDNRDRSREAPAQRPRHDSPRNNDHSRSRDEQDNRRSVGAPAAPAEAQMSITATTQSLTTALPTNRAAVPPLRQSTSATAAVTPAKPAQGNNKVTVNTNKRTTGEAPVPSEKRQRAAGETNRGVTRGDMPPPVGTLMGTQRQASCSSNNQPPIVMDLTRDGSITSVTERGSNRPFQAERFPPMKLRDNRPLEPITEAEVDAQIARQEGLWTGDVNSSRTPLTEPEMMALLTERATLQQRALTVHSNIQAELESESGDITALAQERKEIKERQAALNQEMRVVAREQLRMGRASEALMNDLTPALSTLTSDTEPDTAGSNSTGVLLVGQSAPPTPPGGRTNTVAILQPQEQPQRANITKTQLVPPYSPAELQQRRLEAVMHRAYQDEHTRPTGNVFQPPAKVYGRTFLITGPLDTMTAEQRAAHDDNLIEMAESQRIAMGIPRNTEPVAEGPSGFYSSNRYQQNFRKKLTTSGWQPQSSDKGKSPSEMDTLIPRDEVEWETIRVRGRVWRDGLGLLVTDWELENECTFIPSTAEDDTKNCYVRRPEHYKYKNIVTRQRLRQWEEGDMQTVLDKHNDEDPDKDGGGPGGGGPGAPFTGTQMVTASGTKHSTASDKNKGHTRTATSTSQGRKRCADSDHYADSDEPSKYQAVLAESLKKFNEKNYDYHLILEASAERHSKDINDYQAALDESLRHIDLAQEYGSSEDIDIAHERRMQLSHPAHAARNERPLYASDMEEVLRVGGERGCDRHKIGAWDPMMPAHQSWRAGYTLYFNTAEGQYMFGNGVRISKELFNQLTTICTKTATNERYVYDLSKVRTDKDWALSSNYFNANSFVYVAGRNRIDKQFREAYYCPAFERLMHRPTMDTVEDVIGASEADWNRFITRDDHLKYPRVLNAREETGKHDTTLCTSISSHSNNRSASVNSNDKHSPLVPGSPIRHSTTPMHGNILVHANADGYQQYKNTANMKCHNNMGTHTDERSGAVIYIDHSDEEKQRNNNSSSSERGAKDRATPKRSQPVVKETKAEFKQRLIDEELERRAAQEKHKEELEEVQRTKADSKATIRATKKAEKEERQRAEHKFNEEVEARVTAKIRQWTEAEAKMNDKQTKLNMDSEVSEVESVDSNSDSDGDSQQSNNLVDTDEASEDDSDTNSLSDKLIANRGPPSKSTEAIAEEKKREEKYRSIKAHWPHLKGKGFEQVQQALEVVYLEGMRKALQGAKGTLAPTAPMRQAAIYIAEYAPTGTILPSLKIAAMQEELLSTIMTVKYREPGSLHPKGYSVYFKDEWPQPAGKIGKKLSKKATEQKKEREEEENLTTTLTTRGRAFYVGKKTTREAALAMSPEDRRYTMSILKGRFFIDASEPIPGEDGHRYITALINCQRYNDSKNNVKIVAPTTNDIAELVINEYQLGQEVCMAYHPKYDWSAAKIELVNKISRLYTGALRMEGWRTLPRVLKQMDIQRRVDELTMNEYAQLVNMSQKALKLKAKTDPYIRDVRSMIDLVEGRYEQNTEQLQSNQNWEGRAITEVKFPLHLTLVEEFREDMQFGTYRDPDLPRFDFEPYRRLLKEVARTKRLITSVQRFRKDTLEPEYISTDSEAERRQDEDDDDDDGDKGDNDGNGDDASMGHDNSDTHETTKDSGGDSEESDQSDAETEAEKASQQDTIDQLGLSMLETITVKHIMHMDITASEYDNNIVSKARRIVDRLVDAMMAIRQHSDGSKVRVDLETTTCKLEEKVRAMEHHLTVRAMLMEPKSAMPTGVAHVPKSVKETKRLEKQQQREADKEVRIKLETLKHVDLPALPPRKPALTAEELEAREKVKRDIAEAEVIERAELAEAERKAWLKGALQEEFRGTHARAQIMKGSPTLRSIYTARNDGGYDSGPGNNSDNSSKHSNRSRHSARRTSKSRSQSRSPNRHGGRSRSHRGRKHRHSRSRSRSRSSSSDSSRNSRERRGRRSHSRQSSRGFRRDGYIPRYLWEERPIPEGKEELYLEETDLNAGIFNHRYDCTIKVGINNHLLIDKMAHIPNVNLLNSRRVKNPEDSLTTEQLGRSEFNGRGTIDFLEHVLLRMEEHCVHPLAILNSLQDGRWMTKEARTQWKNAAAIDKQAAAFRRVMWSDPDRTERAIIGLDDLIPKMILKFPDYSQVESDPRDEINKLHLQTPTVVGLPVLLTDLRICHMKLPPGERTFENLERLFEAAIEINPNKDPKSVLTAYLMRKRTLMSELQIDLRDMQHTEWRRDSNGTFHQASRPTEEQRKKHDERRTRDLSTLVEEMSRRAVQDKEVAATELEFKPKQREQQRSQREHRDHRRDQRDHRTRHPHKDQRREHFMREGRAIHVNKMEANIAQNKKRVQLVIQDANMVSDDDEADTTFEMSDSDSDFARDQYMENQWEEHRDKVFQTRFDPRFHDIDGRLDSTGPTLDMIITHLSSIGQPNPSHDTVQREMRTQIPIEERDHCECCGYTGHLAETCSVINADGKIDKALLAGMQQTPATRRMYAAWTRGGQLTGMTHNEYNKFVEEVDAMRMANPGFSQQYSNNSSYRGGGRGGGYNNGGGRFGNNNQYGGGRGTSQRGQWQNSSAGGQFRNNWSGPSNNNHDYYQSQQSQAQPQKPWQQPGYGPKELYQQKSQQPVQQQDTANKVITTTPDKTTTNTATNSGATTTVHMMQASKTAGTRRVPARATKGTPIVRFTNADGQETDTEGKPVKRARSGQLKNNGSGVRIVCNIMGVSERETQQYSPTVKSWLTEKPSNNLGLTYFQVNILHANDWEAAEDLETIIRDPEMQRLTADVQFDNGAGHSVMSPEFAKRQGYQLHKRAVDGAVVGFNGEESRIAYFVIVGVEVSGTDIHGKAAKRVFVTQALITPNLHVDFVMGANVALEHNVCVIPDEGHATMFRGMDKLTVPCMDWEDVQEGLRSKLKQRLGEQDPLRMHTMIQRLTGTALPMSDDIFSKAETASIGTASTMSEESDVRQRRRQAIARVTDEDEAKTLRRRMIREQQRDSDTDFMVRCTQLAQQYCNQGDDAIAQTLEADLLDMVLADPTRYTRIHQDSKTHRFALAILVILARALNVREEYFNLVEVMDTMDELVFAGPTTRELIGTSQLVEEMDNEETKRAIGVLRLMVETMIYGHPDVQLEKIRLHTIEEAVNVFDETKAAEEEEWALSQRTRKEIDEKHATDSMHEMRPAEFPEELWRYVLDTQKPLVKARFARYPEKRLAEVITKIAKIDVSEESRARKAEAPYFKAMNLAHISSFEHPDPFNQPTVKGFEFKIEIEGDDPPAAARFQRFDPWETQFLHVKIKKMVEEKKMERSSSSWNARLALVPYIDRIQKFITKHGDNTMTALYESEHADEVATFFRLTSDLRNVNLRTKAQIYPLPNISDLLSQCKGCDRYTSGDVCDAFFTIRMQVESRQYTAFSTPDGHFHYMVMPQGAKNAATYWAEMIATVFRQMLSRQAPLIIYQDDVGNRGKDLLTHLRVQEEIYTTLEKNEMIFKTTKMHCNYKMQRVLGHVLSGKGRVPDPKTLEAVRDLKEPTTLKEVRSVLGLFQYAREYIENLSSIMDPIQQLTKKGVDIKEAWDPKVHGVAFEALKLALTSAPILKIPDVSKPFKIQVDACRVGRGIGAILLQEDEEGTLRPCAYWSRALTDAERRYSATELEATALHDTILHWKVYLRNMLEFEAIVDHYALVYMVTRMGSEVQNQRLLRLCLDLQGFRFKVTHQAGVKHIGADAVSRLLRTGEEHYVRDEDELRDDWGPLTEKDKEKLNHDFGDDAKILITTINEKREEKRLQDLEQQKNITTIEPEIREQGSEAASESETEGAGDAVADTGVKAFTMKMQHPPLEAQSIFTHREVDPSPMTRAFSSLTNIHEFKIQPQSLKNTYDDEWGQLSEGDQHSAEPRQDSSRICEEIRDKSLEEIVMKLQSSAELREELQRAAAESKNQEQEMRRLCQKGNYNRYLSEMQRDTDQPATDTSAQPACGASDDRREREVRQSLAAHKRVVWRSNQAVCKQLRAHEDKLVAIQRERLQAQGDKSLEEIKASLKVQRDLEDMLRSQKRVLLRRAAQQQQYADKLREQREVEQAMSAGYGAPTEVQDKDNNIWHYGRTATGAHYKRPGHAPCHPSRRTDRAVSTSQLHKQARRTWVKERNKMSNFLGMYDSEEEQYESWREVAQEEMAREAARREQCKAATSKETYSAWRQAGSPTDTNATDTHYTDFAERIRELQTDYQNFSSRVPRPAYRGEGEGITYFGGLETHTIPPFARRAVHGRTRSRGLLGKRLAQYATRSLMVAVGSPLLMQEAKDQLEMEIMRRQNQISGRSIASTPTRVLWERLETVQRRIHSAWHNEQAPDKEDRRLVEDIEAEFVNREIHKERKAYEARITQANKGIAEAMEKIQQLKLTQNQKDAARAGLEREQVRLDMDRAIDEMLQCEREGVALTSTRLILAQQEYLRMTPVERSQRAERVYNYITTNHQAVEEIHHRVENISRQIDKDMRSRRAGPTVEIFDSDDEDGDKLPDLVTMERTESDSEGEADDDSRDKRSPQWMTEQLHSDSDNDKDNDSNDGGGTIIDRVHVHMLDSRKQKLKAQSQKEMTEVERVQRESQALASQKRAQDNTLKVQAKKQLMTEKLQKNTVERMRKMTQLEAELKALIAIEKKKSTDEFINEEMDRAIDNTIEDHGDFLIGQMYVCPDTQVLYQVIDVVLEKERGNNRLMTVARPKDRDESGTLAQSERQKRDIHGINGATELITRYEKGQRDYDDIPLPTNDNEWLTAQLSDDFCKKIIAKLGEVPNAVVPLDGKPAAESEEYYYRALKEDRVTLSVLKRRAVKVKNVELRDTTVAIKREVTQLVVPTVMQDKILWIMHDQMGHPGRSRTTETIRLQYHWEGLYTQVTEYCKGCRYCNLRKANNRVAKVPIMIYNFAERPNSRVHCDLAGPFPLAKNGGHYIMVLKDALTKWVTLIPVYSKDMYTVQKAYLEQWTSIFGAPDMLITDRGTEFHNRMAKQLAELWGVRKVATTPRNPRSDGQVENQMRTMKDMLQSYIQKNQLDWDEYLTLVAQAYNTTVNEATGMTPYFLMYGREMNLASEEHTESMEVADFHEMVQKAKEIQQWYWAYAGDRVVKNSERHNRVPAERLEYKPYSVGDFFYHRVVPKRAHKTEKEEKAAKISSKLQFRYVGPYMVDEVISPTVYSTTVHGKTRRVHALNMKAASIGRRKAPKVRDTPIVVEQQPTRRARGAKFSAVTDAQPMR